MTPANRGSARAAPARPPGARRPAARRVRGPGDVELGCRDREGDGFEATQALRARGVSSLVVLALVAKGRREGVLVLLDQHPQPGLDR